MRIEEEKQMKISTFAARLEGLKIMEAKNKGGFGWRKWYRAAVGEGVSHERLELRGCVNLHNTLGFVANTGENTMLLWPWILKRLIQKFHRTWWYLEYIAGQPALGYVVETK